MHKSKIRFVAIAAMALAAMTLAACSSSSKASNPGTSPAATTTVPGGGSGTAAKTTVALGSSKFGKILVDSKGMSLYVDENDKPGTPACTGACLQAWPPVVASASPTFGTGLTASKYSSIMLSDGTKQLTVNGSPLYTWQGDTKPGDVTGQDKNGFYAVQASGVKYDPGASGPS